MNIRGFLKWQFAGILTNIYFHGFVLMVAGMVATVMPHGVLFRGGAEREIRRKLLEQDLIEAVIGLMSWSHWPSSHSSSRNALTRCNSIAALARISAVIAVWSL